MEIPEFHKDWSKLSKKELIKKLNIQREEIMRLNMMEDARNRMEEALLKSEGNLRAILDSTHASYSLYDENYKLVAFNDVCRNSTKKFRGIDLKIGMSLREVAQESREIQAIREKFDRAMNGEVTKFERHISDEKHGNYWFEISYSPIYIGGKIKGVTLCNTDITKRKTNELELEQHRKHLEELVKERTAELEEVNMQLKLEIAEKARAEELLRIQRDLSIALGSTHTLDQAFETISKALLEGEEIDCCAVYQVDLENGQLEIMTSQGFTQEFGDNIKTFPSNAEQTKMVRKGNPVYGLDSDIKWNHGSSAKSENLLAVGIVPIHHEGIVIAAALVGSHVHSKFSGGSHDAIEAIAAHTGGVITRLNIEEKLKENEQLYRTLVETSPDAIAMTELDGKVLKFNQQATKLFGYDNLSALENEVKNLFQVITPLDRDSKIENCDEIFEVVNHEFKLKKRDGTPAIVEINASFIRDYEHQPIMIMGIIRDITARKKAEDLARYRQEQLLHAAKVITIGTLVSGIAHEINNPNNFIMLNAPILKKSWDSVKPILEQNYSSQGDFEVAGTPYSTMRDRIPGLLDDILDGSRRIKDIIVQTRGIIKKEPISEKECIDIGVAVESALSLTSNLIKNSTTNFRVDISEDLPVIRGGQHRLESVLINLIENACHALTDRSQGITLRIFTDENKNELTIAIQDQGQGIPKENLGQVKEAFYTTKWESGGTGLGLYITSEIINAMGGLVEVESEVGTGTLVKITIPSQK